MSINGQYHIVILRILKNPPTTIKPRTTNTQADQMSNTPDPQTRPFNSKHPKRRQWTEQRPTKPETGFAPGLKAYYVCSITLIVFLLLPAIGHCAATITDMNQTFITTSDDSRMLIVTCTVQTDKATESPALQVKVFDDTGKTLSKHTSYGGRYYDKAVLSQLSLLAATAAVCSPIPKPVKPNTKRIYQILLPYPREYTIKLDVSLLTEAKPTPAPPLAPPAPNAGSGSIHTDGLYLQKAFAPFTVDESVDTLFREYPEDVLATSQPQTYEPEERHSPAPVPQPGTGSRFEEADNLLEGYGIVPYWELVAFGWSIEKTNKELAKHALTSYKNNSLVVTACTENICDYRLKDKLKNSKSIGFLFLNKKLHAMTVDISTRDMVRRRSLLQALATLYGGTIWSRTRGPEMGNDVSRLEYMAETSGFTMKTAGNKLRIISTGTNKN
ncbi:hypothetical protein [Pseudodesulfovibrio methanolicus]|uniref:Uncharacterized protein n=1 Tax=Pseudodesulfovibrio methanolicus TaxID=3126690 RepID=A0ABZ2IXJ0_9BACT